MKCVLHKDSELTAYFADCKNYNKSTGLDFWLSEAAKYLLLAPLVQDLFSALASQAYAERVFSVCGDNYWEKESPDKEAGEPGIS